MTTQATGQAQWTEEKMIVEAEAIAAHWAKQSDAVDWYALRRDILHLLRQQKDDPTAQLADLRQRVQRENNEIEQTLGAALGYPRYCDDQANFPGATAADGVCVGEHTALTLAMEAARQLQQVTGERDGARKLVSRLEAEDNDIIDAWRARVAELEAERNEARERILDLEETLQIVRDEAERDKKDLRVELEAARRAYERTLPPGYTRQRRKRG